MSLTVDTFVARWAKSAAAERANKDTFVLELCDVLEVPRPEPTTGDPEQDRYVFEHDAQILHDGGKITVGKIDLYKEGALILEAKQGSHAKSKKRGTARRETPAWHIEMRDAFGQALGYARTLHKPPPFLLVADIGFCFDLYASFDGTTHYIPFPEPNSSRLFLKDLGKHRELLRTIFLEPHSLDPATRAARVTREVAGHLAELGKWLEAKGHPSETVSKFLMRCLFTMFAEDVGLLPEHLFTKAIEQYWLPNPRGFVSGVQSLWKAMNEGGDFLVGKLLHFNGGLFKEPVALPLDTEGLKRLREAAKCNWADVEPAIFGTLLERALDPRERHSLGAHYTPRSYVERLVRPTIEEPLRADWDVVQAEVRQLVAAGKEDAARKAVRTFHQKLCTLRVLDPACGSGNFLYVSLDLFKRLEGEVLAMLAGLGETQKLLHLETVRVTPAQFLGIEIKPWAKEIAELVLWIGYLQWHFKTYGKTLPVPQPVLRDYKNIERRDAVLLYDQAEMVLDDKGKPVMRWDGLTYKKSPVTGEDVPDEGAQVPLYSYVNPRKAEWPRADFIVGNPPFVGNKRMRNALGDGYTETLREVWKEVPGSADYVMYWWAHAASLVRAGQVRRFGFITTNSITQSFNRKVVESLLSDEKGSLAYAIPDHPWVDAESGADVRIAMTVGRAGVMDGVLHSVIAEIPGQDGEMDVVLEGSVGLIHADLSAGTKAHAASPLRSNLGLAFTGMYPLGQGFVVMPDDVASATGGKPAELSALKPFFIAKDLTQNPRHAKVIDFYPRSEESARKEFPHLYQWVLSRVKPQRDHDKRPARRAKWWVFAEPVPALRAALLGLKRQIFVPRTAKYFTFQFRGADCIPDTSVVAIATEDAWILGTLSSRAHLLWAYGRGGRLGIGNDPRYQHQSTFNPFPFPACSVAQQAKIRQLGEALDSHRKQQQTAHPDLTITGMYNVLEKLRHGTPLTAAEKVVHEKGLISVLKKLHDDLDVAVFAAYGWPPDLSDEQILERLVKLNAERAEEERNGVIRWLRPEFQNPAGKRSEVQADLETAESDEEAATPAAASASAAWPRKLAEQIAAVRDLLLGSSSPWTVKQVAKRFKQAKSKEVESVLESLVALGLLVEFQPNGEVQYQAARTVAA